MNARRRRWRRRMSRLVMPPWSAPAAAAPSHPGWRTSHLPADDSVSLRHDALQQRDRGEPGALLVLREVLEPEALEQRAQVRLDGVDAERDLLGDLLVRQRGGERGVADRAAERDEDLLLRGGEVNGRRAGGHADGGASARGRRRAVDHGRLAEDEPVAVAQHTASDDPLAVDERAVARDPVV